MTEREAARGGTIPTDLQTNALGLPGVYMQGIAEISPAFSQLAGLVSTVALAAIVSPLAFLLGGVVLAVQASNTAQLAREFPAAGGWYTWIARTLHPRAGFFAGWVMILWLTPVGTLVLAYLGYAVIEPTVKAYYGVEIPWWVYPVLGVALVAFASYRSIKVSARLLLITGGVEICIMIALALSGLIHPGQGGFSLAPLNPGNFSKAPDIFLAIVFAVFVFSGWESVGPLAEESRHPRRYIPLAMVGSVIILMVYEIFATWGYLVGIGVSHVASIPTASTWPVATLAQKVWGGFWLLLLFALLNSAVGVCLGGFNGGTRTLFAMGRSGVLPGALGRVSRSRRTPDNAIHTTVAVSALALVLAAIFGVANVFFTFAIAFTFGLIVMYILLDLGVIRYFLTEGRARFNVWNHLFAPVAAIVVVGYVGYKSAVPLPPPPEQWAPVVIAVYFVIGAALLVALRFWRRDDWQAKAELAFEEQPQAVAVPLPDPPLRHNPPLPQEDG
jgi:amino acid transporter